MFVKSTLYLNLFIPLQAIAWVVECGMVVVKRFLRLGKNIDGIVKVISRLRKRNQLIKPEYLKFSLYLEVNHEA